MKFVTEIGPDGLRRRPEGVYRDEQRRPVRCVVLTLMVLALQCAQLLLEELIWEQNQLYLDAKFAYNESLPEGPQRLHQVQEYHETLMLQWVMEQRLNVDMMVGRPRVRLLYVKNSTCLYPVFGGECFKRLDLGHAEEEIDTYRSFEHVTLEGVQCPPLLDASDLTLTYQNDADLGFLSSEACFNCKYPPGGHVLDIPRPNLTAQPLIEYAASCLAPLNREIFRKFVDASTRLIQLDFTFYAKRPDVFLRVTVAYQAFDLNRWWATHTIETAHLPGLFWRGNYHTVVDDVKVVVLPALVLLLLLLRAVWEPKQHLQYRLLLTLATVGLTAWRLHSQVRAVLRYDELMAALPTVPGDATHLHKVERLMEEERHFPFFSLMSQNKAARDAGIGLVLVSLLHLCQYENYWWHEVTMLVVGIRKALKYSIPFICYFLLLNFVFAVVGHSLFGVCSVLFSEKTNSFIQLIQFQFLGDMDYEELVTCAPGWGEVYFFVASVVLYLVLFNFTFSYVFGMMTEVRRLKTRQLMLEKHDDQVEKLNWPVVRCHRGADLSLADQLRLVTLLNFLTQRKD